jgi:hypothetical protein
LAKHGKKTKPNINNDIVFLAANETPSGILSDISIGRCFPEFKRPDFQLRGE